MALDGLCVDNKCVHVSLEFPKPYFYAVSESYLQTLVAEVYIFGNFEWITMKKKWKKKGCLYLVNLTPMDF